MSEYQFDIIRGQLLWIMLHLSAIAGILLYLALRPTSNTEAKP